MSRKATVLCLGMAVVLFALKPLKLKPVISKRGGSAASIPWSGTRNSEKCKGFIDGSGALAWRGIPFAKPPVKELRWRAPQDPEPWEGVMKTQEFSFPCTQLGRMFGYPNTDIFNLAIGSEDCLYVNIWRTPISHSQMHSTDGVY